MGETLALIPMKPNILSLALVIIGAFYSGQTSVYAYLFDSPATNNVLVSINVARENDKDLSPITSRDTLYYQFLAQTNPLVTIWIPKPEYFCRFELLDGNGNRQKKTPLGEKLGAKFFEVRKFSQDLINMRGPKRPHILTISPAKANGRELFLEGESITVDKLFQIEQAGNYSLRLHFQVFKASSRAPSYTTELVRLPMLEIPVKASPNAPLKR